jgi:hypothetical protein
MLAKNQCNIEIEKYWKWSLHIELLDQVRDLGREKLKGHGW